MLSSVAERVWKEKRKSNAKQSCSHTFQQQQMPTVCLEATFWAANIDLYLYWHLKDVPTPAPTFVSLSQLSIVRPSSVCLPSAQICPCHCFTSPKGSSTQSTKDEDEKLFQLKAQNVSIKSKTRYPSKATTSRDVNTLEITEPVYNWNDTNLPTTTKVYARSCCSGSKVNEPNHFEWFNLKYRATETETANVAVFQNVQEQKPKPGSKLSSTKQTEAELKAWTCREAKENYSKRRDSLRTVNQAT